MIAPGPTELGRKIRQHDNEFEALYELVDCHHGIPFLGCGLQHVGQRDDVRVGNGHVEPAVPGHCCINPRSVAWMVAMPNALAAGR